jgi:hypothetical protein
MSIFPKVNNTIEDSTVKQESKLNMNTISNDVKVKEEPVESEEEEQQQQQQIDLSSSSTIKSEPPVIINNTSKSKETKKIYRNY